MIDFETMMIKQANQSILGGTIFQPDEIRFKRLTEKLCSSGECVIYTMSTVVQ